VNSASHGAVKRIRTPHPNDVLAGRGGGINSHEGNKVFRDYVKVYKNDYNLALSKAEKARVARQVVELVQAQIPSGRFLQRDTGTGFGSYWVEIDDAKAMAKTSQALREGAPTIRAQHKDAPTLSSSLTGHDRPKRKCEANPVQDSPKTIGGASTNKTTAEQERPQLSVVSPLMSNDTFYRRAKLIKTIPNNDDTSDEDATPTLMPTSPVNTPEVLHLDQSVPGSSKLPEHLDDVNEENSWLSHFVDPFQNEEDISSLIMSPTLTRGSSMGSKSGDWYDPTYNHWEETEFDSVLLDANPEDDVVVEPMLNPFNWRS